MMLIHRVVKPASDPIIRQLFILKFSKRYFPDVPVVLGGIEASMRRLTHYDYWKDKLEPSILLSSGADMLIYGMGEQPVRELLRLLIKRSSVFIFKNNSSDCNCNKTE